jgi:hypothetical protein
VSGNAKEIMILLGMIVITGGKLSIRGSKSKLRGYFSSTALAPIVSTLKMPGLNIRGILLIIAKIIMPRPTLHSRLLT